uniref:Fibrous sheath-interacting protein 1 n=1 Tax=Toxocara canis TaxID=6265 RepID=A0A183TYP2_TOXCA
LLFAVFASIDMASVKGRNLRRGRIVESTGCTVFSSDRTEEGQTDSVAVSGAAHESRQCDGAVKTSEYGSCEPSPTNVSHVLCALPDSDYDNDCAAQLQQCECELRKLKRRLKEERLRYREQIVAVQNECDYMKRVAEKATRAVVVAQRAIESERYKNQSLRRRLRDADAFISELQCQLRHERLSREERACTVALRQDSLGAGEALCALSQSSANLFENDFTTQQQFNDLPDEVRNFRVAARCDSPSAAETPLSSTPAFEVSFVQILFSRREEESSEAVFGERNVAGGRQSRTAVRRSFSDSELPALLAAVKGAGTPQRHSSPTLARSPLTPRRLLSHEPEVDKEAIFSSDEDFATLELIDKQLRRRGDVVRFIPPRRTIRDATFRQFGRRERIALAEFDYLHELSTDASAIASSPDCPRLEERVQ